MFLPAAGYTFMIIFDSFARAGGGGSSSGGDGGGIIYVIGYLPMHFLGAIFRRIWKDNLILKIILQVVGWIIAIFFAIFLAAFLGGIGIIIGLSALVGMAAGLYGWFSNIIKQSKKAKEDLAKASSSDPMWNEDIIIARTKEVFMKFQQDWSNQSYESMKQYLTPRYQYHMSLVILALVQMKRKNLMTDIVVKNVTVTDLKDSQDNNQDSVVVGVQAQATDSLIDSTNNTTLYTDSREFSEYWSFVRNGSTWILDRIDQATAVSGLVNPEIDDFAKNNNMYYSPDWGWLLLPQRGQLFQGGKFGTSDINNHVIGLYNQKFLIQLYNYTVNPNSDSPNSYLIAQAILPKSYGNIVVRHKKKLNIFSGGISGLKQVKLEWQDFNNKYDVFATDIEKVTAFELLHPAFMVKLEELPFEVNIEVVDNVVYLYTKGDTSVKNYQSMLAILQEAYKQMKL